MTISSCILKALDSLEKSLGVVASLIQNLLYFHWAVLIIQFAASFFGILICSTFLNPNTLFIPLLVIATVFLAGSVIIYSSVESKTPSKLHAFYKRGLATYNHWATNFRFLCFRAFGILVVNLGVIHLTEIVDELNGWSIGFFLCCHLFVVTLVKLLEGEDIFGAANIIMTLSIFWFNKFPEDDLTKWTPYVFYGVTFVLVLFKNSKIELKHKNKKVEKKD